MGSAFPRAPPDRTWIEQQSPDNVLEQLCRNVIFAQRLAGPGEQAVVVNLVRWEAADEEGAFRCHLSDSSPVVFRRLTWEDLARLPVLGVPEATPLRNYLTNKTLNFRRAFCLQ